MNKAFYGCVMTLPHVVDEVLDRAMPAESRQAKRIVNNTRTLSSGLLAICQGLTGASSFVKITDYQNNHVTYVQMEKAVSYIRGTIRTLLQHSMAIGETASRLLDQMVGYLNLMNVRDHNQPSEAAVRIVTEVSAEVNSRTIHHTTD